MSVSPHEQLAKMISGYWLTQAVYVVAKLGVADRIAAAGGAATADELAEQTSTHAPSLYRLLRALASVGVFQEDGERRFSLTAQGTLLQDNVPGSQRAMAIMSGEEHYHAYGELLYSVQTGGRAFDKVYGQPVFNYLAANPAQAAVFDRAMVSIHGRETKATLDAYDLSSIRCVADIGGGNGSVLLAALQQHEHLRGILFDLPHVVQRAAAGLQAAGVAARCELASGNFFEAIPAGADAYLMRHIIHDWTDDECLVILKNIRRAIPADGRLLVIESVIPSGNDPYFGKLLDLTMLVIPGGRERTLEEYRELFASADFELVRAIPTVTEVSVLEARPR